MDFFSVKCTRLSGDNWNDGVGWFSMVSYTGLHNYQLQNLMLFMLKFGTERKEHINEVNLFIVLYIYYCLWYMISAHD